MATIDIKTASGGKAGSVELDDAIFGIEPNGPVMHQVVTAQLNAKRAGTQSTLTRSEVRGGGAKPWRQKGTGRARAGSSTVPNWRGGGVAMGPKPRSYKERTPKKMKKLALRSALSDRAAEGNVLVVDSWGLSAPSTKNAVAALDAIGAEGRVLVVLGHEDETAYKSFRNLPRVHACLASELNTYDILVSDVVVFTEATLPTAAADDAKAKSAAATAAAAPASDDAAADAADSPYAGSVRATEGSDEAPEGYPVKGNEDSMKYHTPESPFYGRTKAEVWFDSAESAEAAGFAGPKASGAASDEEPSVAAASDEEPSVAAASDEEEE